MYMIILNYIDNLYRFVNYATVSFIIISDFLLILLFVNFFKWMDIKIDGTIETQININLF